MIFTVWFKHQYLTLFATLLFANITQEWFIGKSGMIKYHQYCCQKQNGKSRFDQLGTVYSSTLLKIQELIFVMSVFAIFISHYVFTVCSLVLLHWESFIQTSQSWKSERQATSDVYEIYVKLPFSKGLYYTYSGTKGTWRWQEFQSPVKMSMTV